MYLDASCAAIDATVDIKRRQIETLDGLRSVALHATFASDGWPTKRIKDVAKKIGSGVTPTGGSSGYLDEGIPLLRSQNVHFDGLHLDDVAFISAEIHADMASSQIKPRDVLVNITGASIGRCTYVPDDFGEGNVNQHVCTIRGNEKVDHKFLAAFLSSPMGQGQILSSFTGASRQGLSHKELALIRVPLPPADVQRDIRKYLDDKTAELGAVVAALNKQIETLTAYRKSLIHECVTGQRADFGGGCAPCKPRFGAGSRLAGGGGRMSTQPKRTGSQKTTGQGQRRSGPQPTDRPTRLRCWPTCGT